MNYLPEKPILQENGSYDPITLERYLSHCETNHVKMHEISNHLSVPMHRVIYALGLGRRHFKRRATEAAAFRSAMEMAK